jgi:hypothetical protein
MLTLDPTASARITTSIRGFCWLAQLDFTTGTLYFTTWSDDVISGGQTYSGTGGNVTIDTLKESESGNADKLTISISVVNQGMLAATIGNLDTYRGRRVRLYLQLLDENFQPAGAAVQRWTGRMQPVQVTRTPSPPEGGPSSGKIELPCVRAGGLRARHAEGLRLTDAQQKARYPGDLGLERLASHIERPTPWLTRRFQQI